MDEANTEAPQPPPAPAPEIRPGVRVAGALFALATSTLVFGRVFGWVSFSWLEITGAVTGAACVLLVVARNVWNFPLGIISCIAYLMLFAEGRLFAEAGLQVMFIALGIHGWVAWARGSEEEIAVRRVSVGELTVLAAVFPAVWFGLTKLLEAVNGAAPTLDAFLAALSLASQWALNRRFVETWLGWLVVDQVSVMLFISRGMHLTAALYGIFLVMCVAGLIEWRRNLAKGDA